MFNRKPKQQVKQQKDTEILSKSQMKQLQQAFSDISLSPKGQSQSSLDDEWNKTEGPARQTPLVKAYKKIKNTFNDLNSRQFDMFSYFSTQVGIGKQIQNRRELFKVSMTVNSLQVLGVMTSIFLPRKLVYKVLLLMVTLTFSNQFLQKFMLNYYVEKLALQSNLMEPIQQEARNLLEYKYRISKLAHETIEKEKDQYVERLMEEVDRKNLQYLKFKKVQMLL